jgi:hypothetical protein
MTADHLWNLFLKPDVGGGYLGKSVVNHLVQKNHENFAATYPGGKFSKGGLPTELAAQRECFVAHLADGARLQSVHDFIMQKIPTLVSLRSKMRCINVPDRLNQAAADARAAAAAAAAESPKATLNENMSPPTPPVSPTVFLHP